MRLPGFLRRHPALALVAAGLLGLIGFSLALGFGPRQLAREFQRHRHGREADQLLLRLSEAEAIQDVLPTGPDQGWALRGGSLYRLADQQLTPVQNQGFARLFRGADRIWASASYHRLLSLDGQGHPRHELTLPGTIRELHQVGQLLAVAFEDDAVEPLGRIRFYREEPGYWQYLGLEIPIGLDRWCGFDLKADGTQVLANLPSGRGVGLWSVKEGQLLAQWPTERLARLTAFLGDGRVLFEVGPKVRPRELQAHPENRLLRARPGETEVLLQDFAPVLASTRWPDRSRLAFSDGEGMVRVLDLRTGGLLDQFAPSSRGALLRLRGQQGFLWCASSAELLRLERFHLR